MMKKIKILLLLVFIGTCAKAQFPNTDSLRKYIDKYIKSSVTDAFSNQRLNTALKGLSFLTDSAAATAGASGHNLSNFNLILDGYHTVSGNTFPFDFGTGGSPVSRFGIRSSGLIQLLGGIQLSTANSPDASDIVSAGTGIHYLPQLTTSNRNITLPSTGAGKVLILVNQNANATYHWSFTNTVRDPKGNIISTVLNQTIYYLVNDGVRWVDMMSNLLDNSQLTNGSFYRSGVQVSTSIDSAFNAHPFMIRNGLTAGAADSIGWFRTSMELVLKRFVWGANIIHSSTDSTISVDIASPAPQVNSTISAMQRLGSSVKGITLGISLINDGSYSSAMSNGNINIVALDYQPGVSATGAWFIMDTQGSYTATGYNGVGLFEEVAGTMTLVASSTSDGNIWKATSGTMIKKAFTTPYTMIAGRNYIVAAIYNRSAETTAPKVRVASSTFQSWVNTMDFTNSRFINGNYSATTFPSTLATSAVNTSTPDPTIAGVY
jgi:hypothetical protein